MQAGLARAGLTRSTTIVLSAKHGQSPIDPTALRRVDDGAIIDQLDAAWKATHPSAPALVAFAVDDDGMLMWLSDHGPAALAFTKQFLLTHSAPANTITDPKGTFSTTVAASGLTQVFTGNAADTLVRAANGDTHAPDLIGIAQHGVVYTGGVAKIAEHGGDAADDRDVPLVVSGGGIPRDAVVDSSVQTTQIAPTILRLLGLDPSALEGVRADHTQVLPALNAFAAGCSCCSAWRRSRRTHRRVRPVTHEVAPSGLVVAENYRAWGWLHVATDVIVSYAVAAHGDQTRWAR